ncbi:MAG: helix-turn-helix domain-containing protein [Peptococcaceae bacterium]
MRDGCWWKRRLFVRIDAGKEEWQLEMSATTIFFAILNLLLFVVFTAVFIYVLVLVIKALKKYIKTEKQQKDMTMAQQPPELQKEETVVQQTLGERLKAVRMRYNMTQEFVAEQLGVSRQAVSKWESGKAEPSTANLLALAKLYDISVEDLIKNIRSS